MNPDAVRLTLAALSMVLAVTCGGGVAYATGWDQRGRFLVLIGYSVIITNGQLDNLDTPLTWRTWALLVVTVAAVITTGVFLMRGGPRVDGRSADDQRRVLRPRPAAGGAGHAGDGAGPTGRGAAS